MNEQIKKMMLQATKDMPQGYYVPGVYFEIFAELIVEECRTVVTEVYRKTSLEFCGPLLTVDEEIAKHFYGVEE